MAGKRISRQKLNNALKELPIPVQEHCKRCRMIAGFIVEKINVEDWFFDAKLNGDSIIAAVAFHDVGKLRIPKETLYYDAKADDDKNAIYRSHAEEGVNLINVTCETDLAGFGERSFESYVMRAVTEHHERIDGSGFPRGLRGDEISIVGRIAALADAIDNIFFVGATESRDFAEGLAELERMAGTALDPELVAKTLEPRETFEGFIGYIDTKNKNKRKKDGYGLQFYFSPVQNIRENEHMAWVAEYVINDPYYGILRPESFIPVAETSSQMTKLSKLALERICLMLDRIAERSDEHPLVSVHVTAKALATKTFVSDLCKLIPKYEIKKHTICLVFDEGGLTVEGVDYAAKFAELRDGGFRVAISTAASGATLLTDLDRLPADYLFIDHKFTGRIATNPNTFGMASGILDIAHNLHISVVFLGVDNRAIEGELLKMRVKYACGALYGRALSERELVNRIATDGGDD